MLREMPKIPAPRCYLDRDNFSDAERGIRYADMLRDKIVELGPETVRAFIMEPIGGASTGALVAPDTYYPRIREICDEFGILLIYDEVMTGAGRTGKYLAAEHWRINPDIIALAKGLGAGYVPLGAMLAHERIVEPVLDSGGFQHGYTYAGNPLACAAGLAVIDEIFAQDLMGNTVATGDLLKRELESLKAAHPIIGDVRGKGLLLAFELVSDSETMRPLPKEANAYLRLVELAYERGLILYARAHARRAGRRPFPGLSADDHDGRAGGRNHGFAEGKPGGAGIGIALAPIVWECSATRPGAARAGPKDEATIMKHESKSGTLVLALASVIGLAAPCAQAQTLDVVHNFTGGSDGGNPVDGFVMGPTGILYGTAVSGGDSGNGVVFRLSGKGGEKVLHSFAGGADGAAPNAGRDHGRKRRSLRHDHRRGCCGIGHRVPGEGGERESSLQLRRRRGRRRSPGRPGHGCVRQSLRHDRTRRTGRQRPPCSSSSRRRKRTGNGRRSCSTASARARMEPFPSAA